MSVFKERVTLLQSIEVAVESYTTLYAKACCEKLPQDVAQSKCLHEASVNVIAELKKEPIFFQFESRMIRSENGSFAFSPDLVAPKLILKAFEVKSAEAAVSWLERVLSTEKAAGFSIMALWGVNVDTAIKLNDKITLMPVTGLPDSHQKKWLLEKNWLQSQFDAMPMPIIDAPKVALVMETEIEPLFIDAKTEMSNQLWQSNQESLEDARLALSMFGPCAPVQACCWFTFLDQDIVDAQIGIARSSSHIEIMPIRFPQQAVLDADVTSSLVRKYLSLGNSIRQRIRVSLGRLNQGLRRFRPGDQAMEISIALETLLADGGTENTYKIGLRAALLLGGDMATKFENRAIVGGAYIMRSSLVHSGIVPDEIKVPRLGKMQAGEVAKKAAKVSAEVIQNIIQRGQIPEWFELELQGDCA
jgi:hypothetical protein